MTTTPTPTEREAFEQYITQETDLSLRTSTLFSDGYANDRTQGKWKAWQARAALAQPVPAADVPECKECKGSGDSGWCGPCKVCDGSGIAPTVPAIQVQGEPVAWYLPDDNGLPFRATCYGHEAQGWRERGHKVIPLYRTPLPEQTAAHDCPLDGLKCGIDGYCDDCPQNIERVSQPDQTADAKDAARYRGYRRAAGDWCGTDEMEEFDAEFDRQLAIVTASFSGPLVQQRVESNAPALTDEQIKQAHAGIYLSDYSSLGDYTHAIARAVLAAQGSKP